MRELKLIAMDTSKHVFSLHGVNDRGEVVLRRELRRQQLDGRDRRVDPTAPALRLVGEAQHRDDQRDKGLLLSEDPDRLGRAFTLRPRFLAEAPHVRFNLVGGVLNVVRRATFDVFDQARNIALQYDKILAKQCDIGIRVHRCAQDSQVPIVPKPCAEAMQKRL